MLLEKKRGETTQYFKNGQETQHVAVAVLGVLFVFPFDDVQK
jgi:hypothetical protein